MIAFDLAYELTLGAACAMLDRARSQGSEGGRGPAFFDGLVVSALVYVPLCAAGFAAWPGWQSMYLVDLDAVPFGRPAFAAIATAALFACYFAGYNAARSALDHPGPEQAQIHEHTQKIRRTLSAGLACGWVALLFVLFVVLRRRALSVTSFHAFAAGRPIELGWGAPESLLGGPVMAFLAASGALNAAGLLWISLRARRRGVDVSLRRT